MPVRLIVNADDFGLTSGVNRAIAELHQASAVSSATLMARGPALDDAIAIAHAHPQLGVGCHVVLTDGVPASDPATIPTLLAEDGRSFRPSLRRFILDVLRNRVRSDEICREAVAQIQTLQRAGLRVTHLDTHKHTHVLPAIAGPLLQAAEITGVRAIRNPFEETWSFRFGYPRPFRLFAVVATRLLRRGFLNHPSLHSGRVVTTRGTIGISATGGLTEPVLRQIVAGLRGREGTWELVCHPGYNDGDLAKLQTRLRETREVERRALLCVLSHGREREHGRIQSAENGIDSTQPVPFELIHYGRLALPGEPLRP